MYQRTGEGWIQEVKLTASDARPGALFGAAAAADGGLVLVGAPNDSTVYLRGGAVYVFRRLAEGWQEEAKLVASDLGERDSFGSAVALSGDLAVVGSPGASGPTAGAVYVFRRDGATGAWTEEAKLHAPFYPWGTFGHHVDVAAGAPGSFIVGVQYRKLDGAAAFVFAQTGSSSAPDVEWVLEAALTAMIPVPFGGLGAAVSVEGAEAFALIPGYTHGPDSSHFMYAFRRAAGASGPEWVLEASFKPDQPDVGLGRAIALHGTTALINGGGTAGDASVLVYRRTGGVTWEEQARLTAGVGGSGDAFGEALALDGATALVGAPRADPGGLEDAGAAYAFDLASVLDADGAPLGTSAPVTLEVYPNPARGQVRVTFTLAEGGPARLAFYDALGRRVKERDLGMLPPGVGEEPLDLTGLPPGVYLVRLAYAGGASSTRRLVVLGE